MSLSEYRRKRSFDKTREPELGKALPPGQRAIFVVQLHHASRRHYDFRLQVGDALKSWAVPKGPSYDPKVKRMAVEVEDHPVDYASFEGEIPKGEYGGGHVAQFDHGVWATAGDPEAQLAKGHLRFELFGNKLKGGWHLVRSGKPARQPQWLLFKEDDAYAGTLEADDLLADVAAAPADDVRRAGGGKTQRKALTTVPPPSAKKRGTWAKQALALSNARRAEMEDAAFAPQLAKLGQSPPEGAQWLHEIKWDGYRILATVTDGKVRLWSRNALEWTDKTPEIADAIQSLGLRSAQIDGELIAGRGTKQDFNLLQATLSGERQVPLALAVFDLLHVDEVDISEAPLRERKQLLQQVLEAAPNTHLAYSSHVEGDGTEAFRVAGEQHFEGIISKRADRPYRGGRSDDWCKTKQLASQAYAVVGYTAPKGSRSGVAGHAGPGAWLVVRRPCGLRFLRCLDARGHPATGRRRAQTYRAYSHRRHRPARRHLVCAALCGGGVLSRHWWTTVIAPGIVQGAAPGQTHCRSGRQRCRKRPGCIVVCKALGKDPCCQKRVNPGAQTCGDAGNSTSAQIRGCHTVLDCAADAVQPDQADLPGYPCDQGRCLGLLRGGDGSPVAADRRTATVHHPLPQWRGKTVFFPEAPHRRPRACELG